MSLCLLPLFLSCPPSKNLGPQVPSPSCIPKLPLPHGPEPPLPNSQSLSWVLWKLPVISQNSLYLWALLEKDTAPCSPVQWQPLSIHRPQGPGPGAGGSSCLSPSSLSASSDLRAPGRTADTSPCCNHLSLKMTAPASLSLSPTLLP